MRVASLFALLVLLASDPFENGISFTFAFIPLTVVSRTIRYSMVAGDSSSPLPPSLSGSTNVSQRKRRRKPPQRKGKNHPAWQGPNIPNDIPKLSDLMKDVSMQDFSGDIVMSSPVLHGESSRYIKGNGRKEIAPSRKEEQREGSYEPWRANYKVSTQTQGNGRKEIARSRKEAQSEESEESYEPWRANFRVSTQTQTRIKEAASRKRSNIDMATAVLQTLLKTPSHQCNEVNVVCALTLSAKAMLPSTPITKNFRLMLLQTLDILRQLVVNERLNARQLCNSVWAIAKHYNRDHTILPALPVTTAMSSEDMLGVAEAWILQVESVDTAEKRVKETIDDIATQLTNILQTEKVRKPKVGELCMASWAYGVLQPRRRPPGWAVPPQIGRIPNSNQRDRKQRNVEFITFEQWAQEEDEENGQVIGSPTDSIDRLFDAIGEALCRPGESEGNEWVPGPPLVESCTWSEIANVAWAYASHGYCRTLSSETAICRLAQEATHRLDESKHTVMPRDVSQVVWAIGTLQSDNFRLANDLAELVNAIASHWDIGELTTEKGSSNRRPFQAWSCPDLVQLAISLAHGRIDQLPLLRAVYEEAFRRLKDTAHDAYSQQDRRRSFRTWEVSVLLWAQARLYLREPEGEIFGKFASEAPRWLSRSLQQNSESLDGIDLGPQEQANLAWSLTVLEHYHSAAEIGLLKAIFQEASASSERRHVIQLEHAHQLWQALYILEEDCPSAVEDVPLWFRDYLQEKWSVEKARRKKSSARHRSLSDTLNLMNVAHYNEHDEDIDVAIVLREKASWTHQTRQGDNVSSTKVAVEFDGPNHFTRETENRNATRQRPRALGHTVLKYRLLKREGWTVVRVPYFEFDKIPFWASMERQRYLQRLLKTHANIRFSDIDRSEYRVPIPNRKTRFD